MTRVLYPGSFDPITLGHMDVIRRCAAVFDEVVVAVLRNTAKPGLLQHAERLRLIRESCAGLGNVRAVAFSGLLADLAAREGIHLMVKGLRGVLDFENEKAQAHINRTLGKGLETVLMPSSAGMEHISSTLVREVAMLKGDISDLVPQCVADALRSFHFEQR